ncbi:MAG: PQQ-binding-like beta-propeller repeat protein [Acidobacteriota bacterium]|nr:PQQ-binding-like beta-propeller repeat protein [Acidobacteriota bacterium]
MKGRIAGAGRAAALGAALLGSTLLALSAVAQSWPGVWGPERNARLPGPLEVPTNPQLEEIWRHPVGKGYSEIAVASGRGFLTFSDGERDHLAALDLDTGKEIWRRPLGETYRGHDGSDDGPIATPVLEDGRVVVLDPFGRLYAFGAEDGQALWTRDLAKDFGGSAPYWGYASSPLPVDIGDQRALVVQTGAQEASSLVALTAGTGETLWTAHPAPGNGYSSPVLMQLAGEEQIVAATSEKVFAVRSEDGAVLWSHEVPGEPRRSPVAIPQDRVLVSSWNETALLSVRRTGKADGGWQVTELWAKPVLKGTYSPAVYHQGHLYGMNGTYLVCVDPQQGDVLWRHKLYHATVLLVEDKLWVLGERSGRLYLVEATPERYRQLLEAQVFNPGARSMTGPVMVSGRLLLRNLEERVQLRLVSSANEPPPGDSGGTEAERGPSDDDQESDPPEDRNQPADEAER